MRYDDLPPFLRVEQAQELTQLGRSQLYEQLRLWRDTGGREGIPVVRFGRCLRVPTAALLRLALVDAEPETLPAVPMEREACVEHHYPAALAFLHEHGPDALAVLHDLLQRAERVDGVLMVRCSTRDVAARLGFLSKDSVHRRLRALLRAGVLVDEPVVRQFGLRCYRLHLDGTGITLNSEPGRWR